MGKKRVEIKKEKKQCRNKKKIKIWARKLVEKYKQENNVKIKINNNQVQSAIKASQVKCSNYQVCYWYKTLEIRKYRWDAK